MIRTYFKNVIFSPLFFCSVLGVAVLSFLSTFQYVTEFDGVIYYYGLALDFGAYRKFFMLFAALPFTGQYAKEQNAGMTTTVVARTSVKAYLWSHVLYCFLSAFFTCMIGCTLSILVYQMLGYPVWIEDESSYYDGVIGVFLNSGSTIWKYFFFKTLHYSVSLGVWALSGLAASALYVNTYLAVASPLIFSYILEMFTIEAENLPNLWLLSLTYTEVSEHLWIASCYIIGVFLLIGSIFAMVFFRFAKKRIQGEISASSS